MLVGLKLAVMGRAGVEPATHGFSVHKPKQSKDLQDKDLAKTTTSQTAKNLPISGGDDAELAAVIEAWQRLPRQLKAAIMKLIEK